MKKGLLFILSGPSGSGKTTLSEKLLNSNKFHGRLVRSVSATTRSPRRGEKNGKDYFFISEKMFRYKIRAGHFLEWEKNFNDFYGTPRMFVRKNLLSGKSVLLCIDVKGARTVVSHDPDACRIFVQPPSLAVLSCRLKARKTETEQAFDRRLKTATAELAEAKNYDFVVVNDDLQTAYRELEAFVTARIGLK